MPTQSKRWEARVEIFGQRPNHVSNWVLRDPQGLTRARFYGKGGNKDQKVLAELIAQLLNNLRDKMNE